MLSWTLFGHVTHCLEASFQTSLFSINYGLTFLGINPIGFKCLPEDTGRGNCVPTGHSNVIVPQEAILNGIVVVSHCQFLVIL